MAEFTDRKGDRWVVRECDDDDHCVVVERHMKMADRAKHEPDELDRKIAEIIGPEPDDREPDSFHIPLESLGDLIDALKHYDDL